MRGTNGKIAAGMLVMAVAAVGACEKKKPPPPPPPAAPSKPAVPDVPPLPDPVQIDKVLSAVKPDPRVQFPQDHAPADESLAAATAKFADALTRGDAGAMRGMLSEEGKGILAELEESGQWDRSTKKIQGVRVVKLSQSPVEQAEATSARFQVAVQEMGEAYVLGWKAEKSGSSWVFSGDGGAPTGTKPRASDWDGGGSGSGGGGFAGAEPGAPADPAVEAEVMGYFATELTRRISSAHANGGVPTPGPAAPDGVQAAIRAKFRPRPLTLVPVMDVGIAAAKPYGISEEKVWQFAASILSVPEAELREIYAKGKSDGGATGQGAPVTGG